MNADEKKLIPETIRLDDSGGVRRAVARVLPGLGANLVSFEVDRVEFIYWNEADYLADGTFSGGFNMFPTPCRLAGCAYVFEGREIRQRKCGTDVFMHGLIRDEPMESINEGDRIISRLEITRKHPVFEGFPFLCALTLEHRLEESGRTGPQREGSVRLTVRYALENRDSRNIPFAYGIHPYWRIQGRRGEVAIRIPCDHVMDQRNLVPTGGVSPVAGTDLDLRAPRSIENLALDNIFWRRRPGDTAAINFKAVNRRITIEASAEFAHMIAYTPPEKEFFCVENLTSSPNAPNLAAAGKGETANLLVLPPGESAAGWVGYSVEQLEEHDADDHDNAVP